MRKNKFRNLGLLTKKFILYCIFKRKLGQWKRNIIYVFTVHSKTGHHYTAPTELTHIGIVKTLRFISMTVDIGTKNFKRLSSDPWFTGTILMVHHHPYA